MPAQANVASFANRHGAGTYVVALHSSTLCADVPSVFTNQPTMVQANMASSAANQHASGREL
jgi:hypothetical protein